MGCDMLVALGPATVNGQTLFGLNTHRPPREPQTLHKVPGRSYALGELVHAQFVGLPQVRRTCTVLGSQPHGLWGFQSGVNEHQVALGCSSWGSRLERPEPGLLGTDLVRLTLERSHNARQAVDVLVDLIERHGQGRFPCNLSDWANDNIFLIADRAEAFVVEAAGAAWAAQEIGEVRAVSDVGVIRQDWDRIARGVAGHAIAQGWWPEDGSKLDFAHTLSEEPAGRHSALRRWGRATVLLEEQDRHIDSVFLRRALSDHYSGKSYEVKPSDNTSAVAPLCQHSSGPARFATVSSLVIALGAEPRHVPIAWYAFGPPCLSVHFPVFLEGRLPPAFSAGGAFYHSDSLWWRTQELIGSLGSDSHRWLIVAKALEHLQARFDADVEEILVEAAALKQRGAADDCERLTGSLMQSHVERYDEVLEELVPAREPALAGAARW
jgi:secernin